MDVEKRCKLMSRYEELHVWIMGAFLFVVGVALALYPLEGTGRLISSWGSLMFLLGIEASFVLT